MTHSHTRSRRSYIGRLPAVALIASAAVAGVACSQQPAAQSPAAQTSPAAVDPPALPVAVNCGPGQQALIRSALIEGRPVSQVDCVPLPASSAPASTTRLAESRGPVRDVETASAGDIETVRVVERPVYRNGARSAAYRTADVEPDARAVRSGRSWQKSALIIGSSAGIGAGVGGAIGGKKGALIGAAVGGGGATIWDQITRR